MGWKGTIRSLEAASRRAAREQERHRKRLIAQQKLADKMDALAQAKHEVELHESLVESLLTVHSQCSERVDWAALAKTPAPLKPQPQSMHEDKAAAALNTFSPSLLDRLFGRVEQKRKVLEHEVPVARQRDQDEYKVTL